MSKNILVFMDGTRNKPSDRPLLKDTNVWKLYEASSVSQLGTETHAKYVRGVGTGREEWVNSPADELRLFRLPQWNAPAHAAKRVWQFAHRLPRRLTLKYGASAVGWGVADRIREAYEFVCRHYEPGDRVHLFGFSRGAFEARSLAGFIDAVGLLLRAQAIGPDARRLVDKAYEIYRRGDPRSLRFLATFLRRMTGRSAPGTDDDVRRTPRFRRPTAVKLHFVGVWDTVEALGVGENRFGPLRLNNRNVPLVGHDTAYHLAACLPRNVEHARHALAIHELRTRFEPLLWEASSPGQDLRQVWFAGAHADVGGGYPDTRLSDIALNWMAQEATAAGGHLRPVTFHGVPRNIPPTIPLQPHHAIQGDFFWATPAPRALLCGQAAVAPAVADTLSVHPSAVARLFDVDATTYLAYPFEKEYAWTRHLPGGDRYPRDVAAALRDLDAATMRLQIASVVAAHGRTQNAWTLDPGPRPGSSAQALQKWRTLDSATQLQSAERWLSSARGRFIASGVDPLEIVETMSILLAFERHAAIERFLDDMAAWSRKLVEEAGASRASGLRIREERLPLFERLCSAVNVLGLSSPAPAQWTPWMRDIRTRLAAARDQLQRALPLPVLTTVKLKPGPTPPG